MNPDKIFLSVIAPFLITTCSIKTAGTLSSYDKIVDSLKRRETPFDANGILEEFDLQYLENRITPLTPDIKSKRFLIYNESLDGDVLIEITLDSNEMTKKDLALSLVTKARAREKVTIGRVRFFRFGDSATGYLERTQ